MTTRLNDDQGRALVHLVAALRPDWEPQEIATAIRQLNDEPHTACHLVLAVAADPKSATPAAITQADNAWNDPPTPTPPPRADPARRTEELKARRFREEADAARQRAAHPTRIAAIRAAAGYPRTPNPTRPEGNQS